VTGNRLAARSLLSISTHRPFTAPRSIRIPILLIVAEPTRRLRSTALRVAELAPHAELHRSKGGHYDVYQGASP